MFDSSIRELNSDVTARHSVLLNHFLPDLLKTASPMIMILTKNRQLVYSNRSFLNFIGLKKLDEIIGSRPGEVMNCDKSEISRNGCGGSIYCKYCGFNQALFDAECGRPASKYECQLLTSVGDGYNLRITVSPFEYQNYRYMFCVAENMEDTKYRGILESIFLHDLKNSLMSLNSLAGLVNHISANECQALMKAQLLRISEELESYELMQSIEKGEQISSQKVWIPLKSFIDDIIVSLHLIPEHRNKRVKKTVPDIEIFCDKTLLRRVLINLLKNAMEAEDDKAEISISIIVSTSTLSFKVRNPSVIDEEQQMRIFSRFASTKGMNRGLGTYGAKKIVTNYLDGKLSFVSNEEKGTVFTVRLPLNIR